MCKTKNLDGRELMGLDYQKLSVVLRGVVKKLQKRVEKLEKKKAVRATWIRNGGAAAAGPVQVCAVMWRGRSLHPSRSLGKSAAGVER